MDWIKVGTLVTYLGFSQRSTSGATRRNPLDSEAEAVNYGFADESPDYGAAPLTPGMVVASFTV
jgi:hypothetical protein